MDYTKLKVLVTDGGGRQTLTIIRGLKDIGCHVTALCSSKLDLVYASKFPDVKVLNKEATSSHDNYISFLLNLIKNNDYDILLPIGEKTTDKITANETEIKKYVKIACAPRDAYINAFDKQNTFEIAVANNVPCPNTRLRSQKIEDFLEKANFPIIIKPRNGVGSIGFHKFEKKEDFWPYVESKNINVDDYVVQEFVHYEKRLGTILFMDQQQNVCMAYADEILRWYPIDAGTATLIRSIDDPKLLNDSANLLKAMKWQGVAALSFMVDTKTGEAKLCEINGRIPASIRLSRQCGFNVSKLLVEMIMGERVTIYPPNDKFGLMTRHFNAEIPWFIQSPERFSCKPSWFSWKNTRDVAFWHDDKKPYFVYTLQKLLEFREIIRNKRH